MADGDVATASRAATGVVERLVEESADLRAVALIGPDGDVLAASTGGGGDWKEAARELWEAADEAGESLRQVHVGTDAGEVFGIRSPSGSAAVAVAQRFSLASLMFCDLRAALRELETA